MAGRKIQKMYEKTLKKMDSLRKEIVSLRKKNPDLEPLIFQELRIRWTYNSNAIEGNGLSLGDTAFFLNEGLTSEGKPLKDYLEAKNHAEAIDTLAEIVANERAISESLIKELHCVLMRGIDTIIVLGGFGKKIEKYVTAGKYKTLPNHVRTVSGEIHYYTEPIFVKDEMEKLIRWTAREKKLHPVEKAAIFHYRFVAIHPFNDGNGRMARILMNLILMQYHFPPCVIRNDMRRAYLTSLNLADKTSNLGQFVSFIADEILETLLLIKKILLKKPLADDSDVPELKGKGARCGKILKLLKKPMSVGDILATEKNFKRPTLKSDLKALLKQGKIRKSGNKKSTVYTIAKS